MKKAIVVLLSGMLFGCAATGAKFTPHELPNSQESLLYIYRPTRIKQSGLFPDVYINERKIGSLKMGGYLVNALNPGMNDILLKGDNHLLWGYPPRNHKLNAIAGKSHFYRLDMYMQGWQPVVVGYKLSEIDEAVALEEITNLNESN
jgi:hypothetical protein